MSTTARDSSKLNIFKSMKDIDLACREISHQCGVTMNDSVEARAIAEFMGQDPAATATYKTRPRSASMAKASRSSRWMKSATSWAAK